MSVKLHQLVAVLPTVRAKASAIGQETKKVMGNPEAFSGEIVTERYIDADEEARLGNTATKLPVTTFVDRLRYHLMAEADFINLSAAIDLGNSKAKADIKLKNGTVIAKDVPVVTLIFLEGRLTALKQILEKPPTRKSEYAWFKVEGETDVYERHDVTKTAHERQETVAIQKTAATDKHAATAELVVKKVIFKTSEKRIRSTAISSAESAELQTAVNDILEAVQSARALANSVEVDPKEAEVGTAIGTWLLGRVGKKD